MQERELQIAGGSLFYEIQQNEAYITRLQSMSGEIRVPERVEGIVIKGIGKKAFLSRKFLRRVILPDTIESIGDWAFAYCDNLEQVEMPCREISFGKSVFLECGRLKELNIRGKDQMTAALLAAAAVTVEAYYLLDIREAGSREWLERWDAGMMTVVRRPDQEGFSRQILCGEEDYGSTDLEAFMSNKRKEKIRLMLLRMLYPEELSGQMREELQEYLRNHTCGCGNGETWQVVLKEHGEELKYYRLFTELKCLTEDNFEQILSDIGEDHPEMKAYFMRYKEEKIGYRDFFGDLEL